MFTQTQNHINLSI